MFVTVLVGDFMAVGLDILLHGRVNHEFFANRVAGELPHKLIPRASFLVIVVGCVYVMIKLFKFLVVMDDSVRDCGHTEHIRRKISSEFLGRTDISWKHKPVRWLVISRMDFWGISALNIREVLVFLDFSLCICFMC